MATNRLRTAVTLMGISVALVLAAASLAAADEATAGPLHKVAQLCAGLVAGATCWWTGRDASGVERRWRLWMAGGMAGWSTGQAISAWYAFTGTRPHSPSAADLGSFSLPLFALAALLVFAKARDVAGSEADPGAARHWSRTVLTIDAAMVVASLFVLTWATALGATVRAGAPTTLDFVVAIGYPASDLILIVIVMLLVVVHQTARPYRAQLTIVGLGLVALSISDSVLAYLVSVGRPQTPTVAHGGLVVGPALIALAALMQAQGQPPAPRALRRVTPWAHLYLPYVPPLVTVVLLVTQTMAGIAPDAVEIYVGSGLVALVLARQMITLAHNRMLLERVVDGQVRLTYQAFHDQLTGLANRALFHDRLTRAVVVNRRDRRPFGLIFVDLDDFKRVNDGFGHAAGDALLRDVGERLRSCVRNADTVARLGGDEFGVLIDSGPTTVDGVAERILAGLRRPFDLSGEPVSIGASLGVVVSDEPEPGLTADALLRRADVAMYTGKRSGKGKVVRYAQALGDLAESPV